MTSAPLFSRRSGCRALLGLLLLAALTPLRAAVADPSAAVTIPIWPGVPPGSEGKTAPAQVRLFGEGETAEHIVSSVHRPTLTVVLPPADLATGVGVVICPGGGHRELWTTHEGTAVARWLADHGIAAFILKYRLAREPGSTYRVEVESLADAQRALQLVRSRAAEWHVDPARVGLIGFSAGGELAALAAAHPLAGRAAATDPLARFTSRPDFQALIYPGNAAAIRPDHAAPPAFLLCGHDDNLTPPDALAQAYLRFHAAGVPAELHIFTGVGHGFGIRAKNHFPAAQWPERFRDWLGERGFLSPAPATAP